MNHNEIIKTLNILKDRIDDLSESEGTALEEAIRTVELYERKQKEDVDFQGWAMHHQTMNDLRVFMKKHKGIDGDAKILLLEDDGMGYGARNGYCTGISVSDNKEGKKEIHLW